MDDTPENRQKLVRFVAQEVKKDGKIPPFDKGAVTEIIREAKRRTGRKNKLSLILRDLGGLIRVAGDIAKADNAEITTADHVIRAKSMARSVEQQLADQYLEHRKDYKYFKNEGEEIGRVNGLAVIGDSGVSNKDVHIQFIGTYEGVEGDSASISIATAVVSALEEIPVDQRVAMTGSLSVRGDVLPVGGVTHKIEAAAKAGVSTVIIPKANAEDVIIEERYRDMVEIVPVATINEVFEHSLIGGKKQRFLDKLKNFATVGIGIIDIDKPTVS